MSEPTNAARSEAIQVNLPEGAQELVIRHGTAPSINQPVRTVITGTLGSVSAFVKHPLYNLYNGEAQKARAVLDPANLSATLFLNSDDPLAPEVRGKMTLDEDLVKFAINADSKGTRKREEMASFLRQNRFFFPDKDAHAALVSEVKNFKAKAELDVQQASDQRGNRTNHAERKVQSEVPLNTIIEIPVFKGQQKRRIHLDVCFDFSENVVVFWLESTELDEIIRQETENTFQKLREDLNEVGLLVTEQ